LKRIAATVVSLLLVSCSGQSLRDSQQGQEERLRRYTERHAEISQQTAWSLEGRLSIDDGEDGGSGRLAWQVDGDTSRIDFHAAMGRGAWRLVSDGQGAMLETSDGRVLREPSVNALLQKEIGWTVPVDSLSWWARGLAAPGGEDQLQLDEDGNAEQIVQHGWTVSYRRYAGFGQRHLPTRLNATRDNYRVKLAVSDWRFGTGSGE
jgi:outer membrane lipoprotein LolB